MRDRDDLLFDRLAPVVAGFLSWYSQKIIKNSDSLYEY
jgi:hypothetical protein